MFELLYKLLSILTFKKLCFLIKLQLIAAIEKYQMTTENIYNLHKKIL